MKRVLLLTVMLTSLAYCFAQADEDSYPRRYDKIYKAYIKQPNNVANMIDMAEFYADTLNPMRNYASAMKYISAAEEEFIAVIEDRDRYKEANRLMKKKITITQIRQTKRDIILITRNYLETEENLSESILDTYAQTFKDDAIARRIIDNRRIQLRYQQTLRENSLAAFKSFIQNYSATLEGEEAAKNMSVLASNIVASAKCESQVDSMLSGYLDMEPVQKAAFRRKSEIAYNNLLNNPSPQACRSFLTRYPGSDQYSNVLEHMERQLQNSFYQLKTPREFADFAHDNPDNPLAEKAISHLKTLITDYRDMEALHIYLDEFGLDVDYNDIYLQYYNWHTEEGNKSPLEQFAQQNPQFPYQIALNDELERAELFDTIDINFPFVEKDFKSWTSIIYHLTGKKESFVALQRTLQQFIAAKDWKKIPQRIDFFSICFEDHCVNEVAELRSIIERPAEQQLTYTPIVRPTYDLLHPVMHPDGKLIYYNRAVNGQTVIQCAQATATNKGTVWRSTGNINFVNIDNASITIFNLFDNGNKMLIGKDGDILVAENSDLGWLVSETLPEPVNSPYNDFDAYMLPDGSGILIASDRPGGQNLQPSRSYFHGDTALASDIYFIPFRNNKWGKAVNLGINVNSPYMECSPYISDDLKTLYFVTDGRGGLGYGDIYYTTRDNTADWNQWNTPVNYGKEVNSGFNEISITPSADRNALIIGSNAHGRYGCYSATAAHTFNNELRTVTILSPSVGITFDIVDLKSQTIIEHSSIQPDDSWSSSFFADKQYLLIPHCNGLLIPSIVFSPKQTTKIQPATYDIYALQSLADENQPLILNGVVFEPNRATLKSSALIEIKNLASFLKTKPDVAVEILSHVDGNDDSFCFNLSQSRAMEIKKLLTADGIDPDRVITSPYGNSMTKRNQADESTAIIIR